jgi:hypothetical protein
VDPKRRLSARSALQHCWMVGTNSNGSGGTSASSNGSHDHIVPRAADDCLPMELTASTVSVDTVGEVTRVLSVCSPMDETSRNGFGRNDEDNTSMHVCVSVVPPTQAEVVDMEVTQLPSAAPTKPVRSTTTVSRVRAEPESVVGKRDKKFGNNLPAVDEGGFDLGKRPRRSTANYTAH